MIWQILWLIARGSKVNYQLIIPLVATPGGGGGGNLFGRANVSFVRANYLPQVDAGALWLGAEADSEGSIANLNKIKKIAVGLRKLLPREPIFTSLCT